MPKADKQKPTSVTRSRTVTNKTNRFQAEFGYLREVNTRLSPSEDAASSSTHGRGKGKAKRGVGRPISGSPLELGLDNTLTADITATNTTKSKRSMATTVEPKRAEFTQQVKRCTLCDDLGHDEMLCKRTGDSRPPPLTCKQCKHDYTYTDQKLVAEIDLCSAHRTKIMKPKCSLDKLRKAQSAISLVEDLTKHGTSLEDALKFLGIPLNRYEKLMKRVA